MIRSPRRAGLLVLALMLLGIAASAASALASGACCGGMPESHASSNPAAPCSSVAPTSCCEPSSTARIPMPQGAPVLATCSEAFAPGADPFAMRGLAPIPAREHGFVLARVVLRL